MSTPACRQCAPLLDYPTPRGPRGVLERLRTMIALAGHGFTELPPRDAPDSPLWSAQPRAKLTEQVVRSGSYWEFGTRDVMLLRCDACGRVFELFWTPDRGNEHWLVSEPQSE